jgi:hypothetical protein
MAKKDSLTPAQRAFIMKCLTKTQKKKLRSMYGGNFLKKVGHFFKNDLKTFFTRTLPRELKNIDKFLKERKLISGIATGLTAIPQLAPYATPIAEGAKIMGYGKKKRRKSTCQKGSGNLKGRRRRHTTGGTLKLAGMGRGGSYERRGLPHLGGTLGLAGGSYHMSKNGQLGIAY